MLRAPCILDGRYRVDRLVGEGGFGEVYAGLHLAFGAPIAVKVLRLGPADGPGTRGQHVDRFLDEGRLLTRLRHPNIVAAYDLGVVTDDGAQCPYLVMEWVEGVTLREHLFAYGRALSPPEAWSIFEPLLAALAHAHAAHVVHRDLTPSNVMIVRATSGAFVPRVIDFGVAKAFAPDDLPGHATTTAAPNPFTPAYAAPEHITHARTGPWTDVHALGLLYVELVTGRPPYGRTGDPRQEIVDPERPTPRARGVDVGALEPIIAKAVALRPAERFANAGEMLDAARNALAARNVGGARPMMAPAGSGWPLETVSPASHTLSQAPSSPMRSSRRVVVGASVLGLAAILIGAGVVVAPRARTWAAGGAPSVPLPSDPSPQGASTLSSLFGAGLDARVVAAGGKIDFRQDNVTPKYTIVNWSKDGVGWQVCLYALTVVAAPEKTHAEAHLDAVATTVLPFAVPSMTVAYGADEGAVLFVVATTKEPGAIKASEALRDKIIAGIPLLVRGARGGPTDPIEARQAKLRSVPLTARHLQELSADQLSAQLGRAGVNVTSVNRATPTMVAIGFTRGPENGWAFLYTKDGVALLPGLRAQPVAMAYAVEADALVLVQGDPAFCTKAFLGKVLPGLPAELHVVAAKPR